jgi:transposase
MWVPPETTDPILLHAPTRKSVALFGAVCIRDGRLATRREDTFDAATFEKFLRELLRRRRQGRKIVVIVDNARWHHAKLLEPWLREERYRLRLDFLPPYSPELNPMERVWKLSRRLCTHNRYFELLEELVTAVFDQFDSWHHPNETLRRLCAII